jgi:hypothetical protein
MSRPRQSSHWVITDVSVVGTDLYWCPKAKRMVALDDEAAKTWHVFLSRRFKTAAACDRAVWGLYNRGCAFVVAHYVRRRGKRMIRETLYRGAKAIRGEEWKHNLPPR